ncbi:MAG: hypothetical protein ABIQ56_05260 [Chitinophagaceae bacterium]
MKKIKNEFLETNFKKKLIFFVLTIIFLNKIQAQTCPPLTNPTLFGQSGTFIYCKGGPIGFGVLNSVTPQYYNFSVFRNGVETAKKAGPLDGNGGQLSVSAKMQSSMDAGEYRVTTFNDCGATSSVNFQAFYNSIDNLSITSWGSNAVSFRWASCGPLPAVTYEYAVTTISDPNSLSITYSTTTDTTASKTSLINGTTYYIHVRLKSVLWNGNSVNEYFDGCTGTFPPQTIRFISCSASAPVGTLTPAYALSCVGSPATFTASGGTGYKWYSENNIEIVGVTSATYSPSLPGQYRSWILTGTTCQGMSKSATFTQSLLEAGTFSGGGNYYGGDTVKLGISNTLIGQTYKILKDGIEVFTLQGIGRAAFESEDTIWYNFVINSAAQEGRFTVRVSNPYCAPIDFGIADVYFVTAAIICPGSNTTFTVPSAGTGYTYQWQVNTGSGFTNISNGAPYSGVTTRTLTLTNPPISFYGYIYRNVATGPGTVISSTRTLKFGVTWTGATNTVWGTATNWNCGIAPSANLDVIIPSGSPRYPTVSINSSCKSVDVKLGATFTVATGVILTLTGQ